MATAEKFHGISLPAQYAEDVLNALAMMGVMPSSQYPRTDAAIMVAREADRVRHLRTTYAHCDRLSDLEAMSQNGWPQPADLEFVPPAHFFMGEPEVYVVNDGLREIIKSYDRTINDETKIVKGHIRRSLYAIIAERRLRRIDALSSMLMHALFQSEDRPFRIIDTSFSANPADNQALLHAFVDS